MNNWTYGVVGAGIRDRKTMETYRRQGVAICYRQTGDVFEVWQYSTRSWIPIPERSIDFVKLCELIGEKSPKNRWLTARKAVLERLPETTSLMGLVSPVEVARLLGRSPTRIYRWIQAGAPAYTVKKVSIKRLMVEPLQMETWAANQGYLPEP